MSPRRITARQELSQYDQRRFGARLKLKRLERDITAKALAAKVGVSPSLISKIEKGASYPSMDVLRRIVMTLEIAMGDLMDGRLQPEQTAPGAERVDHRCATVVRPCDRKILHIPSRDLEYQLLTPDAQGMYEWVWVEWSPRERATELRSHAGQESVLVIEGLMDVVVGGECYALEAGDCLTFDASIPHLYRNHDNSKVTWIYVTAPPTL